MQMALAEFMDRFDAFAFVETIPESATPGVPFLMHLVAETPPSFFPRIMAVMAGAEILHFGLGLVVFVDREVFPDADTDFAHETSLSNTGVISGVLLM
jgi:hypothetical protein